MSEERESKAAGRYGKGDAGTGALDGLVDGCEMDAAAQREQVFEDEDAIGLRGDGLATEETFGG
jgi:hypothetical protein